MAPSASPHRRGPPTPKLGPTSTNMPAMATVMPTRNVRLTRWRHSSHPASVTKIGARFASSVELATEVQTMDQCQTPRSRAKKMPAQKRGEIGLRAVASAEAPGATRSAQSHSTGVASATRQKALATGPVSESRTKIGAKAMQQPPARRQRKAARLMGRISYGPDMPASELFSAFVLLTLVIDPFGNVPIVNAMLAEVPPARRRIVILRECFIAFAILTLFMAFGREMLGVMQLTESSLSIAGGVILFMIAIRMVFGHPEGAFGAQPRGEPFIVPLAVPLIAGPSALATVMLMATREPSKHTLWLSALVATMALTTLILMAGEWLQQRLGERVMQAAERLMGLILTAIAVEMLLGGIRTFVESLK